MDAETTWFLSSPMLQIMKHILVAIVTLYLGLVTRGCFTAADNNNVSCYIKTRFGVGCYKTRKFVLLLTPDSQRSYNLIVACSSYYLNNNHFTTHDLAEHLKPSRNNTSAQIHVTISIVRTRHDVVSQCINKVTVCCSMLRTVLGDPHRQSRHKRHWSKRIQFFNKILGVIVLLYIVPLYVHFTGVGFIESPRIAEHFKFPR